MTDLIALATAHGAFLSEYVSSGTLITFEPAELEAFAAALAARPVTPAPVCPVCKGSTYVITGSGKDAGGDECPHCIGGEPLPASAPEALSPGQIEAGASALTDSCIAKGHWKHASDESKAIYRKHAEAVLSAALAAPSTPIDDKSHPRFIAGYMAGLHDRKLEQECRRERAYDAVDATVFSSDMLYNPQERAIFMGYLARWNKEFAATQAAPSTPAAEPSEDYQRGWQDGVIHSAATRTAFDELDAEVAAPSTPAAADCRLPDGRCGICGGDWSVCGCAGMLKRTAATQAQASGTKK